MIDNGFVFNSFVRTFVIHGGYGTMHVSVAALSLKRRGVSDLRALLSGNCISDLGLVISTCFCTRRTRHLVPCVCNHLSVSGHFRLTMTNARVGAYLVRALNKGGMVVRKDTGLEDSTGVRRFAVRRGPRLCVFCYRVSGGVLDACSAVGGRVEKRRLFDTVQGIWRMGGKICCNVGQVAEQEQ